MLHLWHQPFPWSPLRFSNRLEQVTESWEASDLLLFVIKDTPKDWPSERDAQSKAWHMEGTASVPRTPSSWLYPISLSLTSPSRAFVKGSLCRCNWLDQWYWFPSHWLLIPSTGFPSRGTVLFKRCPSNHDSFSGNPAPSSQPNLGYHLTSLTLGIARRDLPLIGDIPTRTSQTI